MLQHLQINNKKNLCFVLFWCDWESLITGMYFRLENEIKTLTATSKKFEVKEYAKQIPKQKPKHASDRST